ncbi:MAG: molybdopterin molybdotransferase MoeA [Candidatus Nezhaarchaeota archaeon]|nr:molybdopterin molybdotransferase MoeA [Candidatus Nezhaarchaeota archaeon]
MMIQTNNIRYIKLEDAYDIINKFLEPKGVIDVVPLQDAYDRLLAEDVVSKLSLPLSDVAHFDGYAIRSIDVASASPKTPVKLKIRGRAYPSTSNRGTLSPGEAIYVSTGSLMPLNADCVLPVEASIVKGDELEVKYAVKPFEHVVKAGSDVKSGEEVLRRGHRLRGQDLTLLAFMGYGNLKVLSKPRVAVIPVGDELTDNFGEVKPGKTPCGHALMISSFVLRDGGIPIRFRVVPDNVNMIAKNLVEAARTCDIIITISGVSKGERDFVPRALKDICKGEILFHGIMIRPGRQTGLGLVEGKPVVMLPGLVHSTITGYHLVAKRAMYRLMGLEAGERPLKAVLASDLDLPQPRGFKRLVFMRLEDDGSRHLAWPLKGESALLSIPVRAHGYSVFNEGFERIDEGTVINVYPIL